MGDCRKVKIDTKIDYINDVYLSSLVYAICNVDLKYILWNDDDICCKNKEHVERVFAYELYHQWSIQCKEEPNFVINAEIPKSIYSIDNKEIKFPDLVLHGGQNDLNNNYVIVEIKRSSNSYSDNYVKDIKKLQIFSKQYEAEIYQEKKEVKGFKHCVFIIEGKNAHNEFGKILGQYEKNNGTSNIIIIFYDGSILKMTKIMV